MVAVSVIVPIYNVEQYLRKCLDSLIYQTFDNFEIICVNDGTPDNSQLIVNEYALAYPNKIRSLIKENGGLADARNFGIKNAIGDYVFCVDPDDWVESNAIELLYNKAISDDAEIVCSDMMYVYDDCEDIYVSGGGFDKTSVQETPFIITMNNSACNKLIKRNLFDDVMFPKGLWYEDLGCIPILIGKSHVVSKVNEPLYNYYQRSNSIMHTENEKIFEIYKAIDIIRNHFINTDYSFKDEVEYMYIRHGLFLTTTRIKHFDNNRAEYLRRNVQEMNKRYPNWTKNKYTVNFSIKEKIIMYLLKYNQISLVLKIYDK